MVEAENLKFFLQLTPAEAMAKLNSFPEGLTISEANKRQKLYGYNEVEKKIKRPLFFEALSHAVNPLVAILLISAIISAFTKNIVEAVIIIIIVTTSIILDYFQTHRSLIAVRKLQEKVASTATVLRNNEWLELPRRDVVVGDIIRLGAGDMVPADALLLEAKDLHIQQAILTGESLPIEKDVTNKTSVSNLTDATNAVFLGSSVVSGSAKALVIYIGSMTQLGQIAKTLTIAAPSTEFEKGIMRFGLFIMKVVIFLVLFVFVVNIFLHHEILDSILFSVALAVGLTPEFLPMITTVTLATAAVHMSHKKVIVKNLAAIQNFGSIDILCSDKTGTLTKNEMLLEGYVDCFGKKSEKVLLLGYLNSLYETGIKNPITEALLKKIHINSLDAAILKHDHSNIKDYIKIDEIPFDFERRCASVVVDQNNLRTIITKGAPEKILDLCDSYEIDDQSYPLTTDVRVKCRDLFDSFSTQGYRVIAVAYRKLPIQANYHSDDEHDLTLAGFLTFVDPPVEDAIEILKALNKEGVNVKILTGDNDLVTRHICQKVGFDTGLILLGTELDNVTDLALAPLAEKTQVFARVTPMQKQRIIHALRSRGHVVGYIGDGINDAPSLHSADVGISVAGAVDVAREAADIILLEQHLSVLLNGILEGRKSFANVMKYLMMGTSSNFGNMLSMAIAVAFLPFLPMLPTQILLNNLLYDTSQITIPTDRVDAGFTKKPRHWNIDIIKRFMFCIGPISSIFDFLTFYVMLKVFNAGESLFQTGWFVESLATQTLVIFVIRTTGNPFKSRPSMPLLITVLMIVAIGMLLPFTPLAGILGFVPLPASYFVFLLSATLVYLLLVQAIKNWLMLRWF